MRTSSFASAAFARCLFAKSCQLVVTLQNVLSLGDVRARILRRVSSEGSDLRSPSNSLRLAFFSSSRFRALSSVSGTIHRRGFVHEISLHSSAEKGGEAMPFIHYLEEYKMRK